MTFVAEKPSKCSFSLAPRVLWLARKSSLHPVPIVYEFMHKGATILKFVA
jgi:hypothetical protein